VIALRHFDHFAASYVQFYTYLYEGRPNLANAA
jgi:hypothetical protein